MTLWTVSIDCRALVPRAVLDFLLARCCLGFPSRSALSLVWLRQYSLRASLPGGSPVRGHYLQANVYSFVCYLVVTPFFRLRYSSAEKEGKSASWIIRLSALLPFSLKSFGFFHSFRSLRCYEFGLRPHSTENPLLEFWRSVGLVFHFEILRISAFHRPTPHGAFTSFSPAKIRYRPRLMFFITRPIIFISTFESGVSTSFLYFLLSDIISSVPSSFRLNLFARHSLFEQNT